MRVKFANYIDGIPSSSARTDGVTSLTGLALGLDSWVQKSFRYYWRHHSRRCLLCRLMAPLVKLNMCYEIVLHNKFSVGSGAIFQNWKGAPELQ